MRRILSERNLVVLLFVMALVVFVFAQQDTKKIEKLYMDHSSSSLIPSPQQSASNLSVNEKNSVASGQLR